MIYVIFEVIINEGQRDKYLELASELRDDLFASDGFLKSERFLSLTNERKVLSLSIWKDEESIEKWRNKAEHRMAQRQGRELVFESYNISVASKIRSYSDIDRREAPGDSNGVFGLN